MKEKRVPTDKIWVVLDTNVLVSALLTSNPLSPPVQIVKFLYKGIIKPLYSEFILEEYKEVLYRKRFNFDPNIVNELIDSIKSLGFNIINPIKTDEKFTDSDDIIFYEVKLSVDDSFLVTGNTKHFPKKHFVVTPFEMISILRNKKLI